MEAETLNEPQLVSAFNEWMRRYIEEPERYEREFNTVKKFLHEDQYLIEPSYGRSCAAYIIQIAKEIEEGAA